MLILINHYDIFLKNNVALQKFANYNFLELNLVILNTLSFILYIVFYEISQRIDLYINI